LKSRKIGNLLVDAGYNNYMFLLYRFSLQYTITSWKTP